MSNNDLLVQLATAIHGPNWQNATARDLDVNVRQVHRWKIGEYEVPDGVIGDLVTITEERVKILQAALEDARRERKHA